jgi:Copper type II ascorbate-dependent monooxygenase, C-terminal domain
MRSRRLPLVLSMAVLIGAGACSSSPSTSSTGHAKPAAVSDNPFPGTNQIVLQAATAYKPQAENGGTDDYHCTLLNPHVTQDSMIVGSDFIPNSPEVHHAILFLVPPSYAAMANAANVGGKGWTCFGETALPGTAEQIPGSGHFRGPEWLTAWAPGLNVAHYPVGTGVPFPAGSLVVMQIHYNLLVGDNPVRVKLILSTVPAAHSNLKPLSINLLPAPPDIPCPSGVTGPLCNRAASLANLGQRFGTQMVRFVGILEQICGRNPQNPPAGDTTSCVWPISQSEKIVMVAAHMHYIGVGMTIVLDAGSSKAKTLLDVTDFNFHDQRSYILAKPVQVVPGDTLKVTCSYNPRLRQELPQLRTQPARFVTWGDGTTDEMCLGLVWSTAG